MNKKQQLNALIAHYLEDKIADAERAAMHAHHAAIDDQSVAETQYDTLAIESAYLAEGQSRRIEQYKQELQLICDIDDKLVAAKENHSDEVVVTSIVTMEINQSGKRKGFYIAPVAAGLELIMGNQDITVITPQSPLGEKLLGLRVDDEININNTGQESLACIIYID